MRIAVTSTHSPNYAPLAAVTTPNHLAYCERHGYDYLSRRTRGLGWPEMLKSDLGTLVKILGCYDAVFKIETDVVFTNMDAWVEDLLKSNDAVVIAREPEGRALLNVGTVLFFTSYRTDALVLMDRIVDESEQWIGRHDDCYWQNHLARMYQRDEGVRRAVRLVEPRLINATDQTGDPEWTWQPGDFVCHCGGGSVESRIERCKEAMRKAGV